MKLLIKIGALVLVIALVFHGLNWVSIPDSARLPALETTYHDQITRLQKIAYDDESRWNATPEICVSDRRLFDRPEILWASVEPSLRMHLIVGDRDFQKKSEFSFIDSNEFAGVVRHWFTLSDGTKISAVSYRKSVKNIENDEVFINLILDLEKMNPVMN